MNIWQSYKQERGCLMHFARLANTLLNDEESARDNRVLACKFAKYSPVVVCMSVCIFICLINLLLYKKNVSYSDHKHRPTHFLQFVYLVFL